MIGQSLLFRVRLIEEINYIPDMGMVLAQQKREDAARNSTNAITDLLIHPHGPLFFYSYTYASVDDATRFLSFHGDITRRGR